MNFYKLFLASAMCFLALALFTKVTYAQEENNSVGEVVEVVEDDDSNSSEEQPLYRAVRAIRDHGRGIGNCRTNRDCRRGQECRYVGRSLIRRCQSRF